MEFAKAWFSKMHQAAVMTALVRAPEQGEDQHSFSDCLFGRSTARRDPKSLFAALKIKASCSPRSHRSFRHCRLRPFRQTASRELARRRLLAGSRQGTVII